jgi:hypothetical protein
MTGVAINTVVKLALDAGAACADYQDRVMRNLTCQRLQVDKIWSFCYAKAKKIIAVTKVPITETRCVIFSFSKCQTNSAPPWLEIPMKSLKTYSGKRTRSPMLTLIRS